MTEISPINFFKAYQSNLNFKIIDVRELYDYERYHIYSSINIPLSLLLEKHYLFLNKKYIYYIICKNGAKSRIASEYLESIGYQAINIIGGLDAWPGNFANGTEY